MNSSFFFKFDIDQLKFPESQANSASSCLGNKLKKSYSNVEKIYVMFSFVCLFVCLEYYVPLENFSLI